jgi:ABC-type glycerol-3-phosphate transport system substrate-binding protein
MSTHRTIDRRSFLKGAAGLSVAGALAACAPGVAPQAQQGSGPALKFADRACVFRYMTGGFTQAGPEDNLVKEYQEEALRREYGINVDIRYESASWADIDALMEVRLQTQGTDSVQRYAEAVLKWIATPGLIRDIDDAVKEYGQNLIPAFPEVGWKYWMAGGEKYMAIPSMRITPADIEYLHIRRDWLDKIDRDVPMTLEELEEVLELFREQRLGGDVTIPLALENPNWTFASFLCGPWVPEPEEQLAMMGRGEAIDRLYGSVMREERLDYIQRLYGKGLLNPEWPTWQYDQVFDAATSGIIGCLSGGWWLTNDTLQRQVEGADPTQDWVQIFPPLGLKDRPETGRIQAGGALERGLVVTSWAECPEAIVALADWENKSFDNYLISRYGIPDKHWKWGEGGWIEDLRTAPPNREYSGMRATTWTSEWSNKAALLPPRPGMEPKQPEINTLVRKTLHTRKEAHVPEAGEYPAITQVDHWLPYMFNESAVLEGDMQTTRNEYFTKIVKGELPVVAGLQEFWDKWMAAGGEVRLREVTEQFNPWIESNPEWQDPNASLSPESWNTERVLPPRKS